jgi:hypothetical protein
MDIQVDFFRWQVPDLKEYLQHRGVACHLNRKHETPSVPPIWKPL